MIVVTLVGLSFCGKSAFRDLMKERPFNLDSERTPGLAYEDSSNFSDCHYIECPGQERFIPHLITYTAKESVRVYFIDLSQAQNQYRKSKEYLDSAHRVAPPKPDTPILLAIGKSDLGYKENFEEIEALKTQYGIKHIIRFSGKNNTVSMDDKPCSLKGLEATFVMLGTKLEAGEEAPKQRFECRIS